MKNIIFFTDGSCIKKKGIENKCGYGIHFPNKELIDISEKFTYGTLTNQRSELYAIYKGLKKVTNVIEFEYINIYTDSMYSINSLTIWIMEWKKNNWKTSQKQDVANQDIIKKIDKILQKYPKKIFFHHVRSHTGKTDYYSKCNEIADKLATAGALK